MLINQAVVIGEKVAYFDRDRLTVGTGRVLDECLLHERYEYLAVEDAVTGLELILNKVDVFTEVGDMTDAVKHYLQKGF